jgi:3-oxoadipate enol-lactonase
VRGDHTDILHQINVPTLVVVGEFDRLTSPELAKDIADQIPCAKLEIISNAGHLSNIENSDAFNKVVLDFLLNLPE